MANKIVNFQVWYWTVLSIVLIPTSGYDSITALMFLVDQCLFWETVGRESSLLLFKYLLSRLSDGAGEKLVLLRTSTGLCSGSTFYGTWVKLGRAC